MAAQFKQTRQCATRVHPWMVTQHCMFVLQLSQLLTRHIVSPGSLRSPSVLELAQKFASATGDLGQMSPSNRARTSTGSSASVRVRSPALSRSYFQNASPSHPTPTQPTHPACVPSSDLWACGGLPCECTGAWQDRSAVEQAPPAVA